MAVIEALGSKIRVFKWDLKPQGEDGDDGSTSALNLLGAIFLIRLSMNCPSSCSQSHNAVQEHEVFSPKSSLKYLESFESARKLLGAVLKQLPHLGSCKNFPLLAGTLAADLIFKFNFGPEILSGQVPVPVVFLRLVVNLRMKESEPPSGRNYHSKLDKLIYVKNDPRVNEIRGVCKKFCYQGRNDGEGGVPWGFDEVKAELEIRFLDEQTAAIDYGDDDDPEGNQCPICCETFAEGTMIVQTTSCSSIFHKRCIYEWLTSSNSCPICGSICTVNV